MKSVNDKKDFLKKKYKKFIEKPKKNKIRHKNLKEVNREFNKEEWKDLYNKIIKNNYNYVQEVEDRNEDFHTVKTLVEYKHPIKFDQIIDVCIKVKKIGRSSLTFYIEIHPNEKDFMLASGEVIWVNADQSTHKSAALPESLCLKIRDLEEKKL